MNAKFCYFIVRAIVVVVVSSNSSSSSSMSNTRSSSSNNNNNNTNNIKNLYRTLYNLQGNCCKALHKQFNM